MQLIDTLAGPLEPSQYADTYQQELEKLIEVKAHSKKLTVMPRPKRENVVDLMSALMTSLAKESSKKGFLRSVHTSAGVKEQKTSRKAG